MKKLLSKILIMTMLLSVIYVPNTVFASNDFSLSITEDAFGIKEEIDINIKNKVKGSKYTWISSNEKIATVDKVGVVKGLKAGDVIITCIITTPYGETHEITSDIAINSKTKVTVVNQKQLEEALVNEDVEQIIIKTSVEKEFVIPEGKYGKRLYMKAPTAEIINEGDFKSVHTYVSNQEQLDKALANEKVTIVTIVTEEEENFEIIGDHSRIRVIVNAPAATVLNNAILRRVDVKEVNKVEEKVYVPEVKEEETEVIPIPEEKEEDVVNPPTGNHGGGSSGGGGYIPRPSNPTPTPTPKPIPTEGELIRELVEGSIRLIEAERDERLRNMSAYDAIVFYEMVDNALLGFTGEIDNEGHALEIYYNIISKIENYQIPESEEGLELKRKNMINDISNTRDQYLPRIPDHNIKSFHEMVNDAINAIYIADTEESVLERYNFTIFLIENYQRPDNMTDEERLADQARDYQRYQEGKTLLISLYYKYAYGINDGYDFRISDVDHVITFEDAGLFVYTDTANNKSYTFNYDEIYGLTMEELVWATKNRNTPTEINGEMVDDVIDYLNPDVYPGFIVSFNPSLGELAIVDLSSLDITTTNVITYMYTKWQEEGKWYFADRSDPSSFDRIYTVNGRTEVSTSTVSGSSISFDLYMNDNEVDRVIYNESHELLDSGYYEVIKYDNNMGYIEFNSQFVEEIIMTQLTDTSLAFNIFTTKPDVGRTIVTIVIIVDHLPDLEL